MEKLETKKRITDANQAVCQSPEIKNNNQPATLINGIRKTFTIKNHISFNENFLITHKNDKKMEKLETRVVDANQAVCQSPAIKNNQPATLINGIRKKLTTNHLPLTIIMFFALLINSITSFAQAPDWKWLNAYTGGIYSSKFEGSGCNYIVSSHLDEDGNTYIFGSFDGGAKMSNGEQIYEQINVNRPGIIVAKLNPNGYIEWKQIVGYNHSGVGDLLDPNWIEFKEDKIYFSFNFEGSFTKMIFFDQIINGPNPFPYNRMSVFVTLDYDGNILDKRFITLENREISYSPDPMFPPARGMKNITEYDRSIFHVDSSGNWYIFTTIDITDTYTQLPYTLHLYNDSDSVETSYDFFIDKKKMNGFTVYEPVIIKLNNNWTVDWIKPMNDTIITNNNIPTTSNSFIFYKDLSFDNEDNMYISGRIGKMNEFINNFNALPLNIYLDAAHNHKITMNEAISTGFLIKYNTNGDVQWCNQLYLKNISGANLSVLDLEYTHLGGTVIKNNDIFIVGEIPKHSGIKTYLDFAETIEITSSYSGPTSLSFLAKYNKQTGAYITHGVTPSAPFFINYSIQLSNRNNSTQPYKPAIIGNDIYAVARYDRDSNDNKYIIAKFDTNCQYLYALDTIYSNPRLKATSININQQGEMFFHTYSSILYGSSTPVPAFISVGDKNLFSFIYETPDIAAFALCTGVSTPLYSISGFVSNNGIGLGGVEINYETFAGSTKSITYTDANGHYTISFPPNHTTVKVKPYLGGYDFNPPSVTTSLDGDIIANFTADYVSIATQNINNITFYPNPANNILYFSEETTFEITDIQGRLLLKSNTAVKSVNISSLQAGMYFLKIDDGLNKFVKE